MKKLLIFVSMFLIVMFYSCEKENSTYKKILPSDVSGGFNRGNFLTYGNKVAYYQSDSNKIFPNIYEYINESELEYDITFVTKNYHIAFFNDNNITLTHGNSLLFKKTVHNIVKPVKVFHSDWSRLYILGGESGNEINIVNASDFSVIKKIGIEKKPDDVKIEPYFIYLASTGSHEYNDSTVLILNSNTWETESEVVVGYRPIRIIQNNGTQLYVLCQGRTALDQYGQFKSLTESKIYCYDLIIDRIIDSVTIGSMQDSFLPVKYLDDVLIEADGIYKVDFFESLSVKKIISGNFTDIVKDERIYGDYLCLKTSDQASTIYQLDIYNEVFIDSLTVDYKIDAIY